MSLGGLTWSGAFRSTGVKAVVMEHTRASDRLCCSRGVLYVAVSSGQTPRSTSTTQWRLACLLRLEDEAARIAVAVTLGSELGSPHTCRRGSLVEATGVHGLVCKQAPSRVVRHHALNRCISRAFSAAGIPARKEPAGLVQRDGKRLHSYSMAWW